MEDEEFQFLTPHLLTDADGADVLRPLRQPDAVPFGRHDGNAARVPAAGWS
jgi:hypothetical protein